MATASERKTVERLAAPDPEQTRWIVVLPRPRGLTFNFTQPAALAHARDVLADRRLFVLTDAAWTEFPAALDRGPFPQARLRRFAARSMTPIRERLQRAARPMTSRASRSGEPSLGRD